MRRALLLAAALCMGMPRLPGLAAQAARAPVLSGCEMDYPPYCIVTPDHKADGFSVELLRASLEAVGREVTFETGAWPWIKQGLIDGRLQALPLVARTPDREALFGFTFPYLTMHGTIIVRNDNTDIHGPEDLKGKRVAVLQGDYAAEFLQGAGWGAIAVLLPSFDRALRELSSGQHDAVVIQKLLAFQIMLKAGLRNIKSVGLPLAGYEQSFCFAVRKEDDSLLAALNEGLAISMADGTFRRLYTKWFSDIEAVGWASRPIVVGGDSDFPPYEFLDDKGRPAGLTVELTQSIARRMGLSVEIQLRPRSSVRKALQDREIDVIQGMFQPTEPERSSSLSPPHALIPQAIVTRKGSPEVAGMAALAGKSILVAAGGITQERAAALGYRSHLVAAPSEEEALRRLSAGEGDCAFVARPTALYWIRKNGWRNLRVAGAGGAVSEYCYAVSRGHDQLLAPFTKGLAILKETGEYAAMQAKWLGPYEPRPDIRTIVRYASIVAVPLLLLLAAFLLWTTSLRRAVSRRTAELSAALAARHALAADLQMTAQRLSLAKAAARAGIWDLDLVNNHLVWDERMFEIYGIPQTAFGADYAGWLNSVHPEDRQAALDASQAAIHGETEYDTEFRILRPDGEIRHLQAYGTCVRSAQGTALRMIGLNLDITERKQIEEALRRERDFAERLLQTARIIVLVLDNEGRIVRYNAHMEQLTGYRLEEVRGADWFDTFLPARDRDGIRALFANALEGIQTRGNVNAIVAKDGREIDIEWYYAALKEDDGRPAGVLSTGQDVTERKRMEADRRALEQQMQHTQKLESLGVLAGGIAHDFNNLLMAILGNADIALQRLPPASPVRARLDAIRKATLRAADLTGQLLSYSGRGVFQLRHVDVSDTVDEIAHLLESSLPKTMRLEKRLPRGQCLVEADPGQIQQVVTNLIVNASEAIPEGCAGEILVETGVGEYAEDQLRQSRLPGRCPPGKYVFLKVSDNGRGIEGDMMGRLFDPFFSTKFIGRGLGLSVVLGVVRAHMGAIIVESTLGHGSTFTILLPFLEKRGGNGEGRAHLSDDAKWRGTGCVLIADDDAAVLDVVALMLADMGFSILTATDGQKAVEVFKEHATEISLVLLDLTMPGMGGEEAFAEIHRLRADVPVLLCSGYSESDIMQRMADKGFAGFIQKPYGRENLRNVIRAWGGAKQ